MVNFQDQEIGSLRIASYSMHFNSNSAGTRSLVPSLSQHTIEILQELNYSEMEIDLLKKEGVIC
jgi:crotonobetainyl-CoA:carnitine CoA-transferase CaiB-like acyl-CoA transferase